MSKTESTKTETITIKAPRFRVLRLRINGTSPYMQARFWANAKLTGKAGTPDLSGSAIS